MKLIHQLWHNHKWNLDTYFINHVGDWFILNAYSIDESKIWWSLSWYKSADFLDKTFLDLQYYWWCTSQGWKLNTYDFHPIHLADDDTMTMSGIDLIFEGINYQINKGFKKVIIPHSYYDITEIDKIIWIIKSVNKRLSKNKLQGIEYYMTLPISNNVLWNDEWIENLLFSLTDLDIIFDGYYITCEAKPATRKKINDEFVYYNSLYKILKTLKKQDFSLIYWFANFDALIFFSLIDIDYISFGSYENLRNFDIKKFTEDVSGWPSKWWYFSEKLLNMVKADNIELIRINDWMSHIANENNIFSEEILTKWYIWNTHKAQIHKNYLLSIYRLFQELWSFQLSERKDIMISKIEEAKNNYKLLEDKNIFLLDESSDYHLNTWLSFLKSVK